MYKQEITDKKMLLDVIDALDKLNKNYVIKKSIRQMQDMPGSFKYDVNIWLVEEVQ